jgi:hypothetical protein
MGGNPVKELKANPGPFWEDTCDQLLLDQLREDPKSWVAISTHGWRWFAIFVVKTEGYKSSQGKAQVDLFKASPDLFDALTDLEAEISNRFGRDYETAPTHMTEDLQRKVLAARAAIAKAKGETR